MSSKELASPAGEGLLDAPAPAHVRVPVLDSSNLFAGCEVVVIRHNGRDYLLRRTRFGKLILTA